MKVMSKFAKLLTILVLVISIMPGNTVFALEPDNDIPDEVVAMEIKKVDNFKLAWWDKGSGGANDGAYYKPVVPMGYYAVGYYGQSNYNKANGFVYAVKPCIPDAIASPTNYKLVWRDKGSGAKMDGYFWQPIPPSGYVAMGMVVTNGNKPKLDEVVCIKKEYVLKAKVGSSVWNDRKTGSDVDFGSWRMVAVAGGVSAGTFFGITSHTAPSDNALLWCFNSKYLLDPTFEMKKIYDFNLVWWDKESGGVGGGAYYKPVVPDGYYSVGYYGQSNYNQTNGFVYAIKPCKPDAIAFPSDYKLVWRDKGSGAKMDGYFWQPIPPSGYVAMGMVVTNGAKPKLDEVVCIKKEYVLKAKVGSSVWNDKGTGSDVDFGSWSIDAVTVGISAGTFFGITSHTAPSDNDLLWCFNLKYIF